MNVDDLSALSETRQAGQNIGNGNAAAGREFICRLVGPSVLSRPHAVHHLDQHTVAVLIYDVPMQIATVKERIANIYRKKFGDEKSQRNLSPVTHVAKKKNIPPFLILHVAEHPETKAQSQRLAKALQKAGISARAFPANGKDHLTINADLGLPDDEPTKALFVFVAGVLKK